MTEQPTLSLVVPMYNEEEVMGTLFDRLATVLDAAGESYEVICVNDGSRDATARLLAEAHARDPRIKALHFSRNFGKEIAMTAGLDHASGQAVVPIDADLQDPPEVILEFLAKWRAGYDVVYGLRRSRATDSYLKRRTAAAFYGMISRIGGIEIPRNAGDFRLMDARVVAEIRSLREHNRFMKGLFAWVGFRQTSVEYDRPERAAGDTKFNYWKLWNFAIDGITGFSTVPLRIAGYVGGLTAMAAVLYALFLVVRTLIQGVDVPGYASLMVAVLFLGGGQLMVLGVIGEYLGRIAEETRQRPLYIIDDSQGLPAPVRRDNTPDKPD